LKASKKLIELATEYIRIVRLKIIAGFILKGLKAKVESAPINPKNK